MPLCERINIFVRTGEILCRPIAWILLPDFLSLLSFASDAFHYFLFRSWTPKNPSVDPWESMDPRLGTSAVYHFNSLDTLLIWAKTTKLNAASQNEKLFTIH